MKKLLKNDIEIVFIDDMRQCVPASRWKDFNKYLMYESDLGSDMESISNHFAKIFQYANYKDIENTKKEVENLYFAFFNILERISGKSVALASMVESIGGKPVTDLTEDGLKETASKLEDLLTDKEITELKDIIKKKYLSN